MMRFMRLLCSKSGTPKNDGTAYYIPPYKLPMVVSISIMMRLSKSMLAIESSVFNPIIVILMNENRIWLNRCYFIKFIKLQLKSVLFDIPVCHGSANAIFAYLKLFYA